MVTYFRTSLERKSSSSNLLWDKLGEEASSSGNLLWDKLGEEASTSDLALRSQLSGGCDFMPEDVLSDLVRNFILSFKAFNETF